MIAPEAPCPGAASGSRGRMKAILLAATILLTPAAAGAAEPKFDRDCMDDYGRDLCDAKTLQAIRESFQAPPVETLAKDGWAGVRVYLVDGYSHDLPMVTIARKGDGPVEVETRALRPSAEPRVFRTGLGAWGAETAAEVGGHAIALAPSIAPSPPTVSFGTVAQLLRLS